MDLNKYFSQLIGYKIIGFRFEEDEYEGAPFPVFTIQNEDGHLLDITLSSDEEGNEGGFAFIEEIER